MAVKDRLLERLPTGVKKTSDSRNAKWLSVPASGIAESEERITVLINSRSVLTATGGALDAWGKEVNVPRDVGEGDVAYRTRILAKFRTIRSTATRDEVLKFVADALNLPITDVKITENVDVQTGAWRSRYYFIEAPVSGLVAQGLDTQAELDAVMDQVEALLADVDAAGVHGVFKTGSTFAYKGDDGDLGAASGGSDDTGYQGDGGDLGAVRTTFGYWGGFT